MKGKNNMRVLKAKEKVKWTESGMSMSLVTEGFWQWLIVVFEISIFFSGLGSYASKPQRAHGENCNINNVFPCRNISSYFNLRGRGACIAVTVDLKVTWQSVLSLFSSFRFPEILNRSQMRLYGSQFSKNAHLLASQTHLSAFHKIKEVCV